MEVLKLADVAVVAEIYAAREQNTLGISSLDLVRKIPGAVYCPHLEPSARHSSVLTYRRSPPLLKVRTALSGFPYSTTKDCPL